MGRGLLALMEVVPAFFLRAELEASRGPKMSASFLASLSGAPVASEGMSLPHGNVRRLSARKRAWHFVGSFNFQAANRFCIPMSLAVAALHR